MSPTINLLQFAQGLRRRNLASARIGEQWDDNLRQPGVGVALAMLSSVVSVFMITNVIHWIF